MSVPHTKGDNIVWNYVKDNIIKGKENMELLDYVGLMIN